jgi:hypothetical protein
LLYRVFSHPIIHPKIHPQSLLVIYFFLSFFSYVVLHQIIPRGWAYFISCFDFVQVTSEYPLLKIHSNFQIALASLWPVIIALV